MIKVIYEGQDITDRVSINACVHDMYSDCESDVLKITLNDTDRVWDSWGPKKDDIISVEYGAARTGKMFVRGVKPENGMYAITAYSMPATAMENHNKAWEKVRFLQIAQEIAGRHGLVLKQYGVNDVMYNYAIQSGQPDFIFFEERCALEGCAFLVYDNQLILYNQSFIEGQGATNTIDVTTQHEFEYRDNSGQLYGSCEVTVGQYSGSFSAGNGAKRTFSPKVTHYVGSNGDAERFAKGLLREANRNAQVGILYTPILPGLAAGSMANFKTVGVASWDGASFIHHIRNNYATGQSKIFFRKPLEGY